MKRITIIGTVLGIALATAWVNSATTNAWAGCGCDGGGGGPIVYGDGGGCCDNTCDDCGPARCGSRCPPGCINLLAPVGWLFRVLGCDCDGCSGERYYSDWGCRASDCGEPCGCGHAGGYGYRGPVYDGGYVDGYAGRNVNPQRQYAGARPVNNQPRYVQRPVYQGRAQDVEMVPQSMAAYQAAPRSNGGYSTRPTVVQTGATSYSNQRYANQPQYIPNRAGGQYSQAPRVISVTDDLAPQADEGEPVPQVSRSRQVPSAR